MPAYWVLTKAEEDHERRGAKRVYLCCEGYCIIEN